MLESIVGRLACVLAVTGLVVFALGAFAITEENRWIVQWVALGGLGIAAIATFAAAVVWAIKPEAVGSERTQP